MQADLIINNIVLIGAFNPSIFDKYFFIKNNIVNESEISPNSSFNAIGAIQLVTPEYNVLISFNQIIITDLQPGKDTDKINQTISSIIKLGNLVNVTALGVNFNWLLNDSSKSLNDLSKTLFYRNDIKILSNYFNSEDSMFGLYASKNFKKSRLKLDIKPNNLQQGLPPAIVNGLLFGFNFHFDVKNKSNTDEVLSYLKDYSIYKEESKKIISIYL